MSFSEAERSTPRDPVSVAQELATLFRTWDGYRNIEEPSPGQRFGRIRTAVKIKRAYHGLESQDLQTSVRAELKKEGAPNAWMYILIADNL